MNNFKYFSAVIFIMITAPLQAASLVVPNTFSAGTPAVAAEVNANFDAAKAAVDDNDARILGNETNIVTNSDEIGLNQAGISDNALAISANALAIGTIPDNTDTLADLACATDQVVRWDGSTWICSTSFSATTEVQVESVTQLLAALTAITDNSASKPYVIRLAPGVYDIAGIVSWIDMKPWVSIVGAGQKSTFIKGASAAMVIEGADDAELRSLTIQNSGAGSNGGTGISCNNVSGSAPCTSAKTFKVKDVQVTATGGDGSSSGPVGLYINTAAVIVEDSNITADGAGFTWGIYTINTSSLDLFRSFVLATTSALNVAGLININENHTNVRDSVIAATGGSNAIGIDFQSGASTLGAYNSDIRGANGTNSNIGVRWISTSTAHIERSRLTGAGTTGYAVQNLASSSIVNVLNSYLYGQTAAFQKSYAAASIILYNTYPNGGAGIGGATCVGINYATGARSSVTCN
ncbi:MAG: hypothetical protein KAU21_13830 [Gammaproteobacteria bacterium]|nr:hypothetical protein [Gammaproteobacteria bacterium]